MTLAKNDKISHENAITDAYRHVLAGETIDSVKTTAEIKESIREFSRYSHLSTCQISEKTGISSRICAALRSMARTSRRRTDQYADYTRFGIPYAVTQLLKGNNSGYLKLHGVTLDTIKKLRNALKS